MKSTVSSKGQITLPREVRRAIGFGVGCPVRFEIIKGGVVVRKGNPTEHPVDRVAGILTLRHRVDRVIDDMRGPRRRHP